MPEAAWPPLPLDEWIETRETVHLWTQMIGKVKLELCPFINQWWEVALSLTATGLSSGLIPAGSRSFEIDLDLLAGRLAIRTSDGDARSLELRPRTVADFYSRLTSLISELGVEVEINPLPAELADGIRFDQDTRHAGYDADAVQRWWRAMLCVERVIQRFRTGFTGKSSPVLFYWGGFDLNHTRFSGKPTPQPADADPVRRFGENEGNFAVGFWPGSRESPDPVLYAYPSPAPNGLAGVALRPASASFVEAIGEFILPYEAARDTEDPDLTTLEFFESAYAGAAKLAGWDLAALTGRVPERRASGTHRPDQPQEAT